jgi:hypothetical protein
MDWKMSILLRNEIKQTCPNDEINETRSHDSKEENQVNLC